MFDVEVFVGGEPDRSWLRDEGPAADGEILKLHRAASVVGGLFDRLLDLPMLIRVKAEANRPKDRLVLPILLATLEERKKRGQGS